MSTLLRHDLELLDESLLKGKVPRNLSWADTIELIGKLGEMQTQDKDESVFVVGGHRAFFKKPHTHELGVEKLARLRKFLHEAAPAPVETPIQPHRMVLVIDHHAARIYQDVDGSRLEARRVLSRTIPTVLIITWCIARKRITRANICRKKQASTKTSPRIW